VDARPPYFLPFPPAYNIVGTLGAFIRLRSPIFDRRTLFDIGAAGPLAGLAMAVPILAYGVTQSTFVHDVTPLALAHQMITVGGETLYLGDSMLLRLLLQPASADAVLMLHPIAVAGWVGLFVTMLNLLPLSQFDGGHVMFALLGRRQVWLARAFLVALAALGWFYWRGWWVWVVMALIIGRGTLVHPRVVKAEAPLDTRRRLVGWLVVLLFALCFMPMPIAV
jgi:membrane-associated protease RseP (regulator of RpoE activity)